MKVWHARCVVAVVCILAACQDDGSEPSGLLHTTQEALGAGLNASTCDNAGAVEATQNAWCGGGSVGLGTCADGACQCASMWCFDASTGQCTVARV